MCLICYSSVWIERRVRESVRTKHNGGIVVACPQRPSRPPPRQAPDETCSKAGAERCSSFLSTCSHIKLILN